MRPKPRPYSHYSQKDLKDPELGLGYENLVASPSPGGSFASSYSGVDAAAPRFFRQGVRFSKPVLLSMASALR